MNWSGEAPCRCSSPGGAWMTSPGWAETRNAGCVRAEEYQPDRSDFSTISLSWVIAVMALGHPA